MKRFSISLLASITVLGYASTANAADLYIEPSPEMPGFVQTPSGHWDGAFVGVFGGYAGGTVTGPIEFDLNGYLVGVNGGANFTLANGIVAGIVGDLAWSNIADDDVFLPPSAFDVNWTGSIRGRVGYDAGVFMPYLTAGIAFANGTITAIDGSEVATNTHLGWTVGAGLEIKATDNLSVDLAYRYSDYGAKSYGVSDWEFNTHQVTAGLNWHF